MAKRGKVGRPCKYDEYVKPYLKDIEKMCLSMDEGQIAKSLGVSHESWCKYKREYVELSEAVKRGKQSLIGELHSVLIKRAKGFNYTESKTVRDNDGNERTETYTKACPPDVKAIDMLLRNFDRENWKKDPAGYELRMKELEIQERRLELNEW